MPKIFVVAEQQTLSDLAATLLRARLSKAAGRAALDALRDANPGLDLDRLAPGTVIVVPAVEGLRSEVGERDPVRRAVDDVADRVREGVGTLVAGAEAAEEQRVEDRKVVQELLGSSLVQRLASQSGELAANVDSARAALKNDDGAARKQLAAINDAVQEWSAGLDELGSLLS